MAMTQAEAPVLVSHHFLAGEAGRRTRACLRVAQNLVIVWSECCQCEHFCSAKAAGRSLNAASRDLCVVSLDQDQDAQQAPSGEDFR